MRRILDYEIECDKKRISNVKIGLLALFIKRKFCNSSQILIKIRTLGNIKIYEILGSVNLEDLSCDVNMQKTDVKRRKYN